ncbi:glycosyltransferase family 2 protein [Maricaulis sp. CAU 1757]
MTVSVILPTFRRADGLRRALDSLLAQSRLPDEIIIVDNDPAASARQAVELAAATSLCPIHYVHASEPGVANARNAGWARAGGRHVAFLDDDEIASPGWLAALLSTADERGASVVFGPLLGDAGEASGLRGALARRVYSRPGPAEDSTLDAPYGCGNSLVDRQAFALDAAPFDPRLNATGGEDDAFFAELARQEARFAWSADAHAVETVDQHRTRWTYLLARSFAFGQGATQSAWQYARHPHLSVLAWMIIGVAQLGLYGLASLPALLLGANRAAALIDRAAQGLGKVLWMDRFEPRFYGPAAAA